jgi:Fe-S cluster assembly protein SufD
MENDVVGCGHGTANGPIDEEQMFYLKTRGFDEDDAKRSLIAAFLNSTLSEMGGAALHEWLVGELTLQLEALNA